MIFGWINAWGGMIVVIMLIPNIIYAVKNPGMENKCTNAVMNVTEQIGRYASMALMVVPLLIGEFGFGSVEELFLYFGATVFFLLAYLILWGFYFKKQTRKKAIWLAVLPTLLFLVSGVLLRHWLLMGAAVLFGTGHIYVTIQNNK